MALRDLRSFCSVAWAGVVRSSHPKHVKAGTKVKPWTGSPASYIAAYVLKKGPKEYQHRLPEGFERPGRWWGLWGMSPQWTEVELDPSEFFRMRRRFRRLSRSRGVKLRVRGRSGAWIAMRGEAGFSAVRDVAWLVRPEDLQL